MPAGKPQITLSVTHSGTPLFERVYEGDSLVAGRAPDCQIVLADQYVSSHHFQLFWDGERWYFKDLGSSNGSWINGVQIKEATLKNGDVICVGATQIVVYPAVAAEEAPAEVTERPSFTPAPRDTPLSSNREGPFLERIQRHIQRNLEAIRSHQTTLARLLEKAGLPEKDEAWREAEEGIQTSLRAIEGELRNLERDRIRMKGLHAAAAMINRVTDLKARLNAILDLALEIMEADCGFLILYDEKSRKISVALHRGMSVFGESSSEEMGTILALSPTPSMSIAREVLRTRQSMVISDLRRGSQFDGAQSILMQEVIAVLCSPMVFDNQLIGLIYVDYRNPDRVAKRPIGPGDRELFEALASLAATAIQNAKFFRNVQLEVERRSNLQRYLSPELVDQVIRQNRALNFEPVRRHATVLFCDIRNFTVFAETTGPVELIRQLNEYFSAMFKAIAAENGSLDKFLGDGLMAFFGPLLELENSEVAAVRAACQMQRAMIHLNQAWAEQGRRGFQIGIGLNAGDVVAGNLGSTERMEYTVIGDAVNVASRLSGAAKPGQILVTRAVAKCLPSDQFTVRELEPITLKGKSEKIAVLEVLY